MADGGSRGAGYATPGTAATDRIVRTRAGSPGAIRMFLFYFNKLGWLGSALVSLAVTLVLFLAFRWING